MMKKLLLFSTLLSIGITVQGQTFSVQTNDTTYSGLATDNTIGAEVELYNNTSGPIQMAWEIYDETLPGSWQSGVCIGAACYPPTVVNGTWQMPVSSSENYILLDFYPNGEAGTGHVTIRFFHVGGNDTAYVDFHGHTITGIDETDLANVQVYPNPFTDQLQLTGSQLEATEMQLFLFDALGNQVYSEVLNGQVKRRVAVAELPSGIYFLRLQSRGVMHTRKLVKQ